MPLPQTESEPQGLKQSMSPRQERVARLLGDDPAASQWRNWKWQMHHAVRDIATFERLVGVTFAPEMRRRLELTVARFPLSVTPYYLSLIDPDNIETDPVFRQAFPSPAESEIEAHDMKDPLAEDHDSPVPGITHRYPDRVLFYASGVCAMYCRHCTRKRKVGAKDMVPSKEALRQGIDYIKRTPKVRDVLISGGDPLMLSDGKIDWLLGEIGQIEHVEVMRIGSRIPVVLPYRITNNLIKVLKKHHPLWLNTHFNHPRELTTSARTALAKLADAGIPLGNQSVLLSGVNDCSRIMKSLAHKLVQNRVRPYYLYQCDLSEGLSHFRTPVGKGIEIMESLIGHTSGFAVPSYVIDAPGGGGKIRVNPNYLVSWSTNKVVLRNYEGIITTYQEPSSYEPNFCDRDCANCQMQLPLEAADESRAIGIESLLSDDTDVISLTPANNERLLRRKRNKQVVP